LPKPSYWTEKGFNFVSFSPLKTLEPNTSLPHARMDQVLQFLLGDKMR